MIVLAALIGIVLPTLSGWCLVRVLEGTTPVLQRVERWVVGWLAGSLLMVYVTFLASVYGGVPLSRLGMTSVACGLLLIVGSLWFLQRKNQSTHQPRTNTQLMHQVFALPLWLKIVIAILGIWTVVKIAAGAAMLLGTPIFLDDAFGNWNLRGKVFFVEQQIVLQLPTGNGNVEVGGVSSYPPAVPLVKTWLAALNGSWAEGLINFPHLLWYLSAIVLLYYGLRRVVSVPWSLLGLYLFSSLPLPLIHGTNPYADVFLSVYLFAAVSFLFAGMRSCSADARVSFLRIGALMAGLLVFTKNEALLLYVPPLAVVLLVSMIMLRRTTLAEKGEIPKTILWYAVWIGVVLVPWIAFKVMHDLPFGNAKSVSGIEVAWQPGVVKAVAVNTFLEGNWVFLPVLLIALLIMRCRRACTGALANITFFLVIVYSGELALYLFTSLSVEALWQTGYARGLVHLAPLAVLLTVILLWDLRRSMSGNVTMEQ